MKPTLLLIALAGTAAAQEHHQHQHPPASPPPRQDAPREPVPPLTDADRAAAFPEIHEGHAAHGTGPHSLVQIDRLEAWQEHDENGLAWELRGWAGGDIHKAWLRSEGERFANRTERSDVELLYGRAVARWWDLVVGVRHDFSPGDSQTFAGIGVIGLAPYKFEVEATAYVGDSGQTRASIEVEYELLLTNRLILQPLVEVTLHGKDDEARGIVAGLGSVEAGLRLRYEFTRRLAPYIGVVYERTRSQATTDETVVVAGLRTWF